MGRRGINHYFRSIYGAPRKKPELVEGILTNNHWSPDHAIFVGDSIDDQIAAAENSIHFIGRVPVGNRNPFTGQYNSKTVSDLTELADSWESLVKP